MLFEATIVSASGKLSYLFDGATSVLLNSVLIVSTEAVATQSRLRYTLNESLDDTLESVLLTDKTVAEVSTEADKTLTSNFMSLTDTDGDAVLVNVASVAVCLGYETYTLILLESTQGLSRLMVTDTTDDILDEIGGYAPAGAAVDTDGVYELDTDGNYELDTD